jgi:hypothetical protein
MFDITFCADGNKNLIKQCKHCRRNPWNYEEDLKHISMAYFSEGIKKGKCDYYYQLSSKEKVNVKN